METRASSHANVVDLTASDEECPETLRPPTPPPPGPSPAVIDLTMTGPDVRPSSGSEQSLVIGGGKAWRAWSKVTRVCLSLVELVLML